MRQPAELDADTAAHWSLTGMPFDLPPATPARLPSVQHAEALARIEYLVTRGHGCGVVSGSRGTGKSWLLATARTTLVRQTQGPVCLIDAAGLDEVKLLWEISAALGSGLSPTAAPLAVWQTATDALRSLGDIGEPVVLLFDHVDQMHESGVRAVARLLRNRETSSGSVVIWSATAPLNGVARGELWPLTDLRIELESLDAGDTSTFVQNSLQTAGATRTVFDDNALASVHSRTAGELRRIGRLCRFALLAAMADEQPTVSRDVVEATAAELA